MDKDKQKALRGIARIRLYHKVFAGPDGRAVLYDLMRTHGILSSNFDKDPAVLASREGERGVVLRIMQILKTDPKQLEERIDEHVSET